VQEYLKDGLVDEMQIHLIPVLQGDGVRLFEHTGRERIELSSSARIFGNIVTPILVLEEGAVFDGQCKTSRQDGGDLE